jgi:hypothetical protein
MQLGALCILHVNDLTIALEWKSISSNFYLSFAPVIPSIRFAWILKQQKMNFTFFIWVLFGPDPTHIQTMPDPRPSITRGTPELAPTWVAGLIRTWHLQIWPLITWWARFDICIVTFGTTHLASWGCGLPIFRQVGILFCCYLSCLLSSLVYHKLVLGTRIGQQLGQVLWTFIQYCYLWLTCVPHTNIFFLLCVPSKLYIYTSDQYNKGPLQSWFHSLLVSITNHPPIVPSLALCW